MSLFGSVRSLFSGSRMEQPEVDPSQTPEEQELVRFVYRLFDDARKARADVENIWKENWKMYRGLDKQKLPKYKKRARLNLCFSIVEAILPWLTERRPEIIYIPTEQGDVEHAEAMQKVVDNLWNRQDIQHQVRRKVKAGLVFGKGFLKVVWDPDAAGGIGEVAVKYVSPFKIYPDPDCWNSDIQDCLYVIESYPLDLGTIRRTFPEKGHLVKPDSELSQLYEGEFYEFETARHDTDDVVTAGSNWRSKGRLRARVIECWFKDDTMEILREQDEDGNKITRMVPKYPGGRVITVANGVLLADRPNPFADGKFPYIHVDNYDNLDEDGIEPDAGTGFWPISEVEQLIPIQNALDELIRRVLDNAALMGNMPWIIDENSNVNPQTLTNQPGLIVRKRQGTEVKREQPPNMPAYIMGLLNLLPTWAETISGIHDVTQGRRPQGITAAAAIAELQEAGQARIRLKARALEKAVKNLGEMIKSRIMQFYTEERMIRIIGPDKRIEFMPFDARNIQGDFDVMVEAGSSLPVSKAGRYNQATELRKMGVIDDEAYLEAIDWPGREKILQRMGKLSQPKLSQPESAGGALLPGPAPGEASLPGSALPAPTQEQIPPELAMAILGLLQQQGGANLP